MAAAPTRTAALVGVTDDAGRTSSYLWSHDNVFISDAELATTAKKRGARRFLDGAPQPASAEGPPPAAGCGFLACL